MKTLDEIAIACGTDRASVFTRTWGKPHDYARHYDKLFTPLRGFPVKLLEVGVGGGEGVRMWTEYFSDSECKDRDTHIYGVDLVHDTNLWDTPGTSGRYTFMQGDQADDSFWKRFVESYGSDFDIIVDDGVHSNIGIITTFNAMWHHLKPGGFYAIEDLNTGYSGPGMFVNPNWPNQIDFLKGKIDELNHGGGLDSIYWAKELCVLRKAL